MQTNKLIIGTRGSPLAMAQTHWVVERLQRAHPDLEVTVETIVTSGDRNQTTPLPEVGQKGIFTLELEQALADGRIDLAVHSAKDLPTRLPAGLAVVCVPEREDPRDVLVSQGGLKLDDLPPGATIGTGSLRRIAQLRLIRPDLQFRPLRGNIDTRIRKAHAGECDAAVLALAGLKRAGLTEHITEILERNRMVPAPNQGILAIEGRADDARVRGILAPLNAADAALAFEQQCRIIDLLDAGCTTPLGALVTMTDDRINVVCVVADPEGRRSVRSQKSGARDQASLVIDEAVADLRTQGAGEIIEACRDGT